MSLKDDDFGPVQAGEWIRPMGPNFKMACCDCSLVHALNFRMLDGVIEFNATRGCGGHRSPPRTRRAHAGTR